MDITQKIPTPQQAEFSSFSDEIINIKVPFAKALGGVLTYTKGTNISDKFFDNKIALVTQQDVDDAKVRINQSISAFEGLQDKISSAETINLVQRQFLLKTIAANILKLTMMWYSVPIEAEKWWYVMDPALKQEYLAKIEKIETELYGPKVSDVPEEKDMIVSSLSTLYQEKSDLLSEEQKEQFSLFLEKFPESNKAISTKEIPNTLKWILHQKDIPQLFQRIFDLYGIKSTIVIIDSSENKVSEVTDKDGILYVPDTLSEKELTDIYKERKISSKMKIIMDPKANLMSTGKYLLRLPSSREDISVKEFCEAIDRSISTHIVATKNDMKTLNMRSDSYLEFHEWVALLNKEAVSTPLSEISTKEPVEANISTFIWENNTLQDTESLLLSYYTMKAIEGKNPKKESHNRAQAVKRFHANDLPGASRNQVVHWRGMNDVVNYVQSLDPKNPEHITAFSEDIKKFYSSKLGKDEFRDTSDLLEGFTVDESKLILPLALGKIIYEKLLNKTLNFDNDIRFLATQHKLSYAQKKLLLSLIAEIKNSIDPRDENPLNQESK